MRTRSQKTEKFHVRIFSWLASLVSCGPCISYGCFNTKPDRGHCVAKSKHSFDLIYAWVTRLIYSLLWLQGNANLDRPWNASDIPQRNEHLCREEFKFPGIKSTNLVILFIFSRTSKWNLTAIGNRSRKCLQVCINLFQTSRDHPFGTSISCNSVCVSRMKKSISIHINTSVSMCNWCVP